LLPQLGLAALALLLKFASPWSLSFLPKKLKSLVLRVTLFVGAVAFHVHLKRAATRALDDANSGVAFTEVRSPFDAHRDKKMRFDSDV